MRYFKILFFLLLTCFSFSQNSVLEKEKFSFTISSTHLIDPWDGSSVRIAIEKPFKDLVFNLEAGKYINGIENYTLKPKIEGYTINPIIKVKVSENRNNFTEYIGFDYLFKDFNFKTYDSLKVNDVTINKDYRISRKVHAISIKYFLRYDFNKHLFYDFYVGLGIRFTSSKSDLTDEEKSNILDDELHGASQIHNEINRTGDFFRPNIYCGVKFGYRIF